MLLSGIFAGRMKEVNRMSNDELLSCTMNINWIANELECLARSYDFELLFEQFPDIDTNKMRELVEKLRRENLKLAVRFGNRIDAQ